MDEMAARENKDTKEKKVHSRSGGSEDGEERPAKVAKTASDDSAPGKNEGGDNDSGKDAGSPRNEDHNDNNSNDNKDSEENPRSRSPAEANEANVAAPTRRSLRPRRPTSMVKGNSSGNGKDKGEKEDKKASKEKEGTQNGGGQANAGATAKREKGESGSGSGSSAAKEKEAKAKREKEERESLHYNGFPLDISNLSKTTKPVKLDSNSCVRILIGREYLSSNNRQVRSRQLWGSEVYTEDSDVVAVLVHMGFINLTLIDSVASDIRSLSVQLKVLPLQASYVSSNSNNIRSRSWNSFDQEEARCSYSIKSCTASLVNGEDIKLYPAPGAFAIIPPTFVPAATERVVNTRSSASSTDRKNRFKQEVTLQYNLCNEPWLKYVMASVADQGLQASKWTSARLHSEVLYAESQTTRYELSIMESQSPSTANGGESGFGGQEKDLFQWSKCNEISPLSEMRKVGVPFPPAEVKVLEQGVEWEHLKWGPNGVHIRDNFYPLSRIHFMERQEAPSSA
ncbi:hypothetical protein HOP50_01g09890 [Chloropicon primus]|uniref:Histone deacetylation protein Rxt3 n=1 Tax=Chloropicon primus TaxID=1764295 RepID=A0A5B8MFP5_9CHLO|nr:hypothetical protein A3770_01p10030 [Chloropicon primus]UPQ97694.1 hypothetical protein HOP50_01g09890 [Chloropicon primus]|mmetsp:Transcript_9838/g.27994  ORF Transcript_9838/g.27994 Transcript_9838/m.27994 type:complete len:511 (+) Transcript_9838:113-1645(+)|eukprot:QDZ18485.1 hypothetical protein A3770_01p10030 [Chloropicon primus]